MARKPIKEMRHEGVNSSGSGPKRNEANGSGFIVNTLAGNGEKEDENSDRPGILSVFVHRIKCT